MKTPKCPVCGGPHYKYMCFKNPKRGKTLANKYKKAYSTGKVAKHDKVLNNQSLNRKRLIMELDKYCSLIVRVGASDKSGIAYCYTCGKRLPYKMLDNGHYRSRQCLATRWDFQNCHPQCQNCNRLLHGNLVEYRKHLVRELGNEKVREIETRPSQKISTVELQEMLVEMKMKYKNLLDKKKEQQYN